MRQTHNLAGATKATLMYDQPSMSGGDKSHPSDWAVGQANRLRETIARRIRATTSARAVSRNFGWGTTFLNDQLNGRTMLRLDVLFDLVRFLEIDPAVLFKGVADEAKSTIDVALEVAEKSDVDPKPERFGGRAYQTQPERDPADLKASEERHRVYRK